jgi:hypothetical protein
VFESAFTMARAFSLSSATRAASSAGVVSGATAAVFCACAAPQPAVTSAIASSSDLTVRIVVMSAPCVWAPVWPGGRRSATELLGFAQSIADCAWSAQASMRAVAERPEPPAPQHQRILSVFTAHVWRKAGADDAGLHRQIDRLR